MTELGPGRLVGHVDGQMVGRASLLREVDALLADGQSVLLVGPEGVGKSEIIRQLHRPGLLVVDPFAGITSPRASALRRALDRGAVVLAAARSTERRDMGHVGRIAWRFRIVHVRGLSGGDIGRILRRRLADRAVRIDAVWIKEAVHVAGGSPGRAVALASVVAARFHERRVIVSPGFALAVARQEFLTRSSSTAKTGGAGPGESSS